MCGKLSCLSVVLCDSKRNNNAQLTHYYIFSYHIWYLSEDTKSRGNKYKLIQHHCHYNLRKFRELRKFTNRVIPIWNSLPNYEVTADTFKNPLDMFWSDQEVLYDYNVDLHGIGNRSFP